MTSLVTDFEAQLDQYVSSTFWTFQLSESLGSSESYLEPHIPLNFWRLLVSNVEAQLSHMFPSLIGHATLSSLGSFKPYLDPNASFTF